MHKRYPVNMITTTMTKSKTQAFLSHLKQIKIEKLGNLWVRKLRKTDETDRYFTHQKGANSY